MRYDVEIYSTSVEAPVCELLSGHRRVSDGLDQSRSVRCERLPKAEEREQMSRVRLVKSTVRQDISGSAVVT